MDIPEVAEPHFSALPSVPFTMNSNQQLVIGFHVFSASLRCLVLDVTGDCGTIRSMGEKSAVRR
jgi:hypothetical protein